VEQVYEFFQAALPWITIGLLLAIFFARSSYEKSSGLKINNYGTEGMCLGMALGSALSMSVFHNNSLGISIGMLAGVILGSTIEKK